MHELGIPTESERVEGWRMHVLIEAGYPVTLAELLAPRGDVDLHQAAELVAARGCTPELAVAILG